MTPLLKTALMPYGTTYAIEPAAARQIMAVLQNMDMSAHLRDAGTAAPADADSGSGYEVNGSVALLSLSGLLTKNITSMQAMLGGTGMEDFATSLSAAVSDAAVQAAVIVIDSPGGTLDGTEELYQCVRDAAAQKPVYAYVPDMCGSAAYWVGCGASAIYAGKTAMVGCIGIYTVLEDVSKAAASAGVQVTVISSGGIKGAGARGTPVTEALIADTQREIDEINNHFVATVSKSRRMPVADARALADGRVHVGTKAQALGLTDGTCRLSELIAKIQADPQSALVDRKLHPNARPGNNNAAKDKKMSKALLASALATLGLHKMAGKAMATPDDDPQALASSVAAEMNAEVEARVIASAGQNPLLAALASADITSAGQIEALQASAKLGETAVAEVRKAACQNAIIAYGQEEGAREAETLAALPAGPALDRYAARIKADALKKAPEGGSQAKTLGTQPSGVIFAQDARNQDTRAAAADAEADALSQTALGRRAQKLRQDKA